MTSQVKKVRALSENKYQNKNTRAYLARPMKFVEREDPQIPSCLKKNTKPVRS